MSCFLEFRHSCLYKIVCLHFPSVPLDRPSWSCIHMKKMTPQYCFIVIIHIIKAQHYVIVYLQKLSYEGRDDCQQKRVRLHLWCRSFNSIGRPQKLILPDRRSSLKQCLVALNWSPIVMKYHPSELCHFSFSERNTPASFRPEFWFYFRKARMPQSSHCFVGEDDPRK